MSQRPYRYLPGIVLALCLPQVIQAQSSSTQIHTADGATLVVRSGDTHYPPDGPRPPFAWLDRNRDGFISEAEAGAYLPLVNDFKHADLNHDGRISATEYAHWH